MSKFPNFFIVGAAKAGTTSVHSYLNTHPDVYTSPIKEPHFFSKDIRCQNFEENYKKSVCFNQKKYFSQSSFQGKHAAFIEKEEDYLSLFKEAKAHQKKGEGSVGYLYSSVAAQEIYAKNTEAKIIIILREPIERAFSHWLMDLRGGSANSDNFLEAINIDMDAKNKSWGNSHLYIELGLYYNQVKRYIDTFGKANVKIILFDDLKKSNEKVLNEILDFLDLKKEGMATEKKEHNKAALPKYPFIQKLLRSSNLIPIIKSALPSSLIEALKNKLYTSENLPKLSQENRKALHPYFDEDAKKLFELIGLPERNWFKNNIEITSV